MAIEFDEKTVAALNAPLDTKHVAKRTQSGRSMSYVEGWHVIAEANRIFGFGGWDRETVEMREVRPPELKNNNGKETWRVGFIAKVRITVDHVTREGTGFGSGALPDLGEAYESAVKEAETDAMKRAFMTFGNPFGLALYDKEQTNVVDAEKVSKNTASREAFTKLTNDMRALGTKEALREWWSNPETLNTRNKMPDDWQQTLHAEFVQLGKAAPTEAEKFAKDVNEQFPEQKVA